MNEQPTVILADYDRKRLDRHTQALSGAGWKVVRALGGSTALTHCRKARPFVVVAEAMIPEGNGFELARQLRADPATATVKILLVIDEGDTYTLGRAQKEPVDGTMIRPFTPDDLVARVRALQAEQTLTPADRPSASDVTPILDALETRARSENPILPLLTDQVTGLWNQHYTKLKLAEEFKKARRFNVPLSCVLLALDEFTPESGDDDASRRQVLNEVAGLLLCESRDIDHLARFDDDQFLLLLPHTDEHGAMAMATRIINAIEKRQLQHAGLARPLTASAGISGFAPEGLNGPEDLVSRTRDALLRARRFGGNRVETWSKDVERAVRS